jgi:hypothetical protein
MTLSALSGGAHQLRAGLLGFHLWPGAIKKKCSDDQSESNYDCDEDGAESHSSFLIRHNEIAQLWIHYI